MFLLCAIILFGGAGGPWFSLTADAAWYYHGLLLATGTMLMGGTVALSASYLFGRHPVRWGIALPFLVYLGGTAVALLTGRAGCLGLLLGAPLFSGLAIAAGTVTTYLIDIAFTRPEAE
jgi:hypothetical protein